MKGQGSLSRVTLSFLCHSAPASSSPSPSTQMTLLFLGADGADLSLWPILHEVPVPCWHLHTILLLPQEGLLKGLIPTFLLPSPDWGETGLHLVSH